MSPEVVQAGVEAVKAGAPIAVKQTGIPTGSIANWLLVMIGTFISGYLIFLPKIRKVQYDRAGQLDDERAADVAAWRIEMNELRKTVDIAVKAAHDSEIRSVTLRAVVQIVLNEIRRIDPDNSVLQQADRMMRDAATPDLGLGRGMADIAAKVGELR